MSYEKELLEVAIYQCGKLTPNEEDRLYKWIESLEVAKRKVDEYETKAKAFDEIFKLYIGYEDGWINFPKGRMSFYKEIIGVCKEYENGEVELERLYDQKAKAKAWDRTQELLEECTHQTPSDDYEVDWHEFEMKIDDIIEKYESGESE